jgi:tripartite-type tricarboxylate transporter receptor subunit TctC
MVHSIWAIAGSAPSMARNGSSKRTYRGGDMRGLISLAYALATCIAAAFPITAAAQPYPARAIKVILPFPAGSATDGPARLIAEELRKKLGQPVIIENQTGADGQIAAQAVKRAAPDGYTLFLSTNSTHASNLSLYKSLPYDPERDFVPIAGMIRIPMIMLVRKDFPAEDVAAFVKVAGQRTATKPLTYGSGNTAGHIAAELLKAATKVDMVHVPYRGSPQALQDLVGGHVDLLFGDPYTSMSLVNGGQLKVLGVADRVRHPLLPNVPTMAETGYKDVELVAWSAFFAPANTDPAITDRLNKEINDILAKPETVEALQKMAMVPMVMSPSELSSFVSSEIERWRRNVELAGIEKK